MAPTTAALVIALLIALVGALAGTAGFAVLVVRRQNRRLVALAEHLTDAQDEGALGAVDADSLKREALSRPIVNWRSRRGNADNN